MSDRPASPLSTRLRVQPAVVHLPADPLAPRLTFRVQSLDGWDAVRVEAPASATVRDVKAAALAALEPGRDGAGFEVKLRGHLLADEAQTLAAVALPDGGILSVGSRRRRPVR